MAWLVGVLIVIVGIQGWQLHQLRATLTSHAHPEPPIQAMIDESVISLTLAVADLALKVEELSQPQVVHMTMYSGTKPMRVP